MWLGVRTGVLQAKCESLRNASYDLMLTNYLNFSDCVIISTMSHPSIKVAKIARFFQSKPRGEELNNEENADTENMSRGRYLERRNSPAKQC